MGIMIGRTVSHYEVTEKLGEGGMGVVYKARDSRLKRFVALKVLPPEKVTDPERKQRFVQEARAASALNHPNIVTVYDIDQSDGVDFIAMEYVEGKTLDELIGRKGMKLNEALKYAIQIADALAKAHAAGIVHRDLKPGNVMVTADGRVKVLDFGLAKLTETTPAGPEDPTLTAAPSTELGMIVGTAAYMSPEQAEGKTVDARSDIFSFGSVFYETLTGRRAFRRDSPALTLAAILHLEPAPLPEGIPSETERIVARCLRKDPERRFQTMADLKVTLEELKQESESGKLALEASSPAKGRRLWTAGVAAFALLAAAGAALWIVRGRHTAPASSAGWQQLTNFTDSATQPALSPDGRMLTFVRGPGAFFTPGQIYVKLLPGGEAVQLTHDDSRKMSPIFTPDGSRIAYTVAFPWDTWVVPVLGGEPHLMLANASGLHWIGPDRLLFSEIKSGYHMALVTARESRTEERDVYVPPHERGMAHRSAISPDGKWVLLAEMENSGWLPCRLVPYDASSSGRRVGPQPGACTEAAWSPDGKWMYFTSDSGGAFHVWRQRLDGGAPERITSGANEEEGIAIAPDGQSLITSAGQTQSEIWLHEAAGERQVSSQGFGTAPHLSADSKRIYYMEAQAAKWPAATAGELWIWDLEANHSERLLPGIVVASYSVSPDDKHLLYSVVKPDLKSEIWLAALDRRSPPRRLSSGNDSLPRFGPDGDIFFMSSEGKVNHLFRMRGDGTGRQRLSEDPIVGLHHISPDGKWVDVLETSSEEESPSARVLFPTDGGAAAQLCDRCTVAWARDGKFFYINLSGMSGGLTRTYAIPLRSGSMMPDLPPAGVKSADDLKNLPGVQIIEAPSTIAPGMSPSTYAFTKSIVHRNLYRLPLP
jgi:Tol biopolymer transport system component/tRNA A-37 threonylcarbamoyl transferase component Bud32